MYLFKKLSVIMGQNAKPNLTTDKVYEVVGCNPAREQFLVIDDIGSFVFVDIYNTRAVKDGYEATDNTIVDQGTEGGGDTSTTKTETGTSESTESGSGKPSTPKATGRFGKPVQGKGK